MLIDDAKLLLSYYQVCHKFPDLKKVIRRVGVGGGGWLGGWVVFGKDKDWSEPINWVSVKIQWGMQ